MRHRAALGKGFGAGRPAQAENVVGVDTDGVEPGHVGRTTRHLGNALDRQRDKSGLLGDGELIGTLEIAHSEEEARLGELLDVLELVVAPLNRHRREHAAGAADRKKHGHQLPYVGQLHDDDFILAQTHVQQPGGDGVDGRGQLPIAQALCGCSGQIGPISRVDHGGPLRRLGHRLAQQIEQGAPAPVAAFGVTLQALSRVQNHRLSPFVLVCWPE